MGRGQEEECQEKVFPENLQMPGQFLIKHIGEGHVILYYQNFLQSVLPLIMGWENLSSKFSTVFPDFNNVEIPVFNSIFS